MKTKKILIFTLIFSFLFIFTTSSFATVDYLGKQLPDFPEEYYNYKHKFIYFVPSSNCYRLVLYSDDFCVYDSSDNCLRISGSILRYRWSIENSSDWSFTDSFERCCYYFF